MKRKEPDLRLRAETVGTLVGRFHNLLNGYPEKLISQNCEFFIGRYLDFLRRKGYPRLGDYTVLGEKLWRRVRDLPVGNCHGDLHRGNLLEAQDGTIYLLDFDTVCRAPIMFDVMVMCDMTDYFQLQATIVEIYGIDCIDEKFVDMQLEWLKSWHSSEIF